MNENNTNNEIKENEESKISILKEMAKRAEESLKARSFEIELSNNIIEEEDIDVE